MNPHICVTLVALHDFVYIVGALFVSLAGYVEQSIHASLQSLDQTTWLVWHAGVLTVPSPQNTVDGEVR